MNQLKTIDQTCNIIIDNTILLGTKYEKEEIIERLMRWSGLARHLADKVADNLMVKLDCFV